MTSEVEDLIVVLVTCPPAAAESLVRGLLEQRLCACVNILSNVRSLYRWEGKIEDATEAMLVVKTIRGRFSEVEAWIRKNHSYENPEIIAFEAQHVAAAYHKWVRDAVVVSES